MTKTVTIEQIRTVENSYHGDKPLTECPFATTEMILRRLQHLRNTEYLIWSAIAAKPEFYPIPFGTLQTIFETGKMSMKWRHVLRWRNDNPRPRCSISTNDMESAYQTIKSHIPYKDRSYLALLLIKNK